MRVRNLLLWLLFPAAMQSAVVQYRVKLNVDLAKHALHGWESIRFSRDAETASWEKRPEIAILRSKSSTGKIASADGFLNYTSSRAGEQQVEFEYSVKDTRGLHWITTEPGVFSTFYCSAWMICSMSPGRRATSRVEIVVKDGKYRAAGPGVERKHWRDGNGEHWLFETPAPVQTYLLSFAAARLFASKHQGFEVLAPEPDRKSALGQTEAAAAFLTGKTGINPLIGGYREIFLPEKGLFGQEAAQFALMTQRALSDLEDQGDVVLMAHELAHQWWGVSIGIRSWSDFWLNEGVAEYVSLLYLEHVRGEEPFLAEIEKLKIRLKQLTDSAPDRPLHFENWKDEKDALGQLPYVKGALFLHEIRSMIGDNTFWRAMARYSQENQGKLVDSSDLERAFEETSLIDLRPLFQRAVYGSGK